MRTKALLFYANIIYQLQVSTVAKETNEYTYLDAIGVALDAEMDADPNVFLIGEDVGQFGGAFKVTKGFLE